MRGSSPRAYGSKSPIRQNPVNKYASENNGVGEYTNNSLMDKLTKAEKENKELKLEIKGLKRTQEI